MNTDKLTMKWQNIARVRLQLKFAFIIRPKVVQCLVLELTFTRINPMKISTISQWICRHRRRRRGGRGG